MRVASLWSGGEDSCLVSYQAMQQDHRVEYLVNFLQENGARSMSHDLDNRLIGAQTQAADISLLQVDVTWNTYEDGFKSVT